MATCKNKNLAAVVDSSTDTLFPIEANVFAMVWWRRCRFASNMPAM